MKEKYTQLQKKKKKKLEKLNFIIFDHSFLFKYYIIFYLYTLTCNKIEIPNNKYKNCLGFDNSKIDIKITIQK